MRAIIVDGYVNGFSFVGEDAIAERARQKMLNRPTPPDGYDYRLRADTLEWELVELPPAPDPMEQEIPAEEALSIILGGTSYES